MSKRKIHFWVFDALSMLVVAAILAMLTVIICKSYEAEAQTWTRTERQVVEWVPQSD